jgi:hypothetical protein
VQLHIEDEDPLAGARLKRHGVGRLHLQHVEETAEYRIHRQQRDRHPAGAPQQLATAHAKPRRQAGGVGEDALLHFLLRRRLGQWRELLVGHEASRQGHVAAKTAAHAGTQLKGVAVPRGHVSECRTRSSRVNHDHCRQSPAYSNLDA